MVDRAAASVAWGASLGTMLQGLFADRVAATFTALAALLIGAGLAFPNAFASDAAGLVALILIAVVGLPHGALDIHLAMRSRLPRMQALGVYGLIALVGGIAWLSVPVLLILVFLALSVWHFAQDFKALGRLTAFGAALSVLLMPILAFTAETQAIFAMLMPESQAALVIGTATLFWPVVAATGAALALKSLKRPGLALATGLAIIAGAVLPPIVAFALYFCAWHSAGHIRAVFADAPVRRIGLGEAALYAAMTLSLLAGLVAVWSWSGMEAPMVRAVFGLLVILTLPHMAIVELWQRRG
ncbi:Brp/Blh family beta-carotene 15,15'-dioxygenase [uncultured Algimonas sp.]|uniref:Brp/Blh family beta-carotene 15,15'-dioxygenase n=1 Tax=uncultured Algimonas sp. TaxID=1547920 RepID=UPI0026016958|nr:Brp/Blh family beta-carotene 15,15'-dioxygenase [uncultured Algimonas sp.]